MARNLSPKIPIGTHDHGLNSIKEIYSFEGGEKMYLFVYSRYKYRYNCLQCLRTLLFSHIVIINNIWNMKDDLSLVFKLLLGVY